MLMLENKAIGYAKCESNSYNTIAKDEIEELIAVTKNHVYLKGADENGLRKFLKHDFTTAKTKEELEPLTAKQALKNLVINQKISCVNLMNIKVLEQCENCASIISREECLNIQLEAIDKLA